MIYLPGIDALLSAALTNFRTKQSIYLHCNFRDSFGRRKTEKTGLHLHFYQAPTVALGLMSRRTKKRKSYSGMSLPLMDVEVDLLRGRKLEAADFRAIVTKDPADTLLRWMGDPSNVKLDLQKSARMGQFLRSMSGRI